MNRKRMGYTVLAVFTGVMGTISFLRTQQALADDNAKNSIDRWATSEPQPLTSNENIAPSSPPISLHPNDNPPYLGPPSRFPSTMGSSNARPDVAGSGHSYRSGTVVRKVPVTETYVDDNGNRQTRTTYREVTEQIGRSSTGQNPFSRDPRYAYPIAGSYAAPMVQTVAPINPEVMRLLQELRSPESREDASKIEELQSLLSKEFDAMHQKQSKEINRMEDRLRQIQERHRERDENKDKIIQRRIATLLGQTDPYAWQPPPVGNPFSSPKGSYRSGPVQSPAFAPLNANPQPFEGFTPHARDLRMNPADSFVPNPNQQRELRFEPLSTPEDSKEPASEPIDEA